jgi:hypothetical protein
MGKWKAVCHGLNQPIELYDLEINISQRYNLAVEYPDILQKIIRILQTVSFESKEFSIHQLYSHLPLAQMIISL